MRRRLLALGLWLLPAAVAVAAEPFARATVQDNNGIVPGQQVLVTVDVFVPDFFTAPPQFPLFDIPDAIVTLPDGRALNKVETIDGTQYSGISRTYAVIPEAVGTFALPPVVIPLGYSQNGKPVAGTVSLPSARFTVGAPSGDVAASLAFAARDLTITRSFDRDPATLKAGDALVGTVTIFARDTQAMMMPAIALEKPEGMSVYAKAPKIADGVEAADRTTGSTRTETITYVARSAGKFEIPPISYPWLDVETHQATTAVLAAAAVVVAPPPAASSGIAPVIEDREGGSTIRTSLTKKLGRVALLAGAMSVIGWLAWLSIPSVRRWWNFYQHSERTTRKRKMAALLAAIRTDDPATVYRCLDVWTRSLGFTSIAGWVSVTRDPEVERQLAILERNLFDPPADPVPFDRAAFARTLKRHAALPPGPAHGIRSGLPEINPRPAPIK